MRALVVAASKHGATAGIAAAIADTLRGRGVIPVSAEPDDVRDLDDIDAVVLGSAVYAGHWLRPAMSLVERLGDELAALAGLALLERPGRRPAEAVGGSGRRRGHGRGRGRVATTSSRGSWTGHRSGSASAPSYGCRARRRATSANWPEVEAWADEIADALGAGTGAGAGGHRPAT